MKKSALLTAAVLLFTLTGCETNALQKAHTGATLEVSLDNSYASERFKDTTNGLFPMLVTEQGVIFQEYDNRSNHEIFYDLKTREITELPSEMESEGSAAAVSLPDGQIGVIHSVYGDVSFTGAGFDYEGLHYVMEVFDRALQQVEIRDVALPDSLGAYLNDDRIRTDSDGWWYFSDDNTLYIYTPALEEAGTIETGDNIMIGSSGAVYYSEWTATDNTTNLFRLDKETMKTEKIPLEGLETHGQTQHLADGMGGDYELYAWNDSGVWGVEITDGKGQLVPVVNLPNSDFVGSGYRMWMLPDGEFLLLDYTGDTLTPWRLRERTQEEKDSVQLLSLAGIDILPEPVVNFNRTHSDIRVVMVDYAQYNDPDDKNNEGGIARFQQDMLNGIAADIICTDNLPFERLANKGLFEDLSVFMKQDERFHEEDYFMNFFESLKYAGQLQKIGFSYSVETIAGDASLVGDQVGYTPQEFSALMKKVPSDRQLFTWMNREMMEWNILPNSLTEYIDTETMTCHFDTSEFIELLELAGSMEPIDYNAPYVETEDIPGMLHTGAFGHAQDFHNMRMEYFADTEMTLVGYPHTGDGNGGIFSPSFTLSMNAQSQHQEEIWDFFMELLSDDWQELTCESYYGLPVRRSAFDAAMEEATRSKPGYLYTYGFAQPEETEIIRSYVEGITVSKYTDPTVRNIFDEEAEMYFAGDQTAEEAAKMIQSRVSLYLSEQS